MTVLVDEARWPWQGRRWAHLVSDHCYDELHGLAQAIGKRRISFQGDHYDVDACDRARAISAGALPVGSRELVQRLRASGLRRSRSPQQAGSQLLPKPRWAQLAGSGRGQAPDRVLTSLRGLDGTGPVRLASAVGRLGRLANDGAVVLFGSSAELAVVIDIAQGYDCTPAAGLAVDSIWLGSARADGERSLELFVWR